MKKFIEKSLIELMIADSFKQDKIFSAGNYWKKYEKKILKQIKENDLEEFRSWPGGAGVGNVQSFGGGDLAYNSKFGRNFHPFEKSFKKFDNNFFVKKYNALINKLIKFIPFLKYFVFRASEARSYYNDYLIENLKLRYELIKISDPELLKISDSTFGKPTGTYINKKFYTWKFLDALEEVTSIKKNINLKEINSIVELGAGIGMLASCFLKLNTNLKYIIIDIPPTLFFSEYYLKNIGFKVFGYQELVNNSNIDIDEVLKKYDAICLPTWKIDLLINKKFDMFINISSFMEMEKEQSIFYLNKIKDIITKYVYLNNSTYGTKKAIKTGDFGVLNPTTKSDCENVLKENFTIFNSYIDENSNSLNPNYKSFFKRYS